MTYVMMSYILSTKQIVYSERLHAVQADVVLFCVMRNVKVLVCVYWRQKEEFREGEND